MLQRSVRDKIEGEIMEDDGHTGDSHQRPEIHGTHLQHSRSATGGPFLIY